MLMSEKNLSHYDLVKVVSTFIYIMNRTLIEIVHDVTLEGNFTSGKPNLAHLKVFGCIIYVHISDELGNKLNIKAKISIFVGYSL